MSQPLAPGVSFGQGLETSEGPDLEAPAAEKVDVPGIYHRENWGLAARIDHSITFEEYQYWAKVEREREYELNIKYKEKRGLWTLKGMFKDRFSKGVHHEAKKEAKANAVANKAAAADEKTGVVVTGSDAHLGAATGGHSDSESNNGSRSPAVSEEEWRVAASALRTSGWGTIFYLITTDILGWGQTP